MPLVGVCAFNLFEFISHICLACMYIFACVPLLNVLIEELGLQLDPTVVLGCSLQEYLMVTQED